MKYDLERVKYDPIYFAKHMLGIKLTSWDARIARGGRTNKRILLIAARGTGKNTALRIGLTMRMANAMNHWTEAQQLMEDYPIQTQGYTLLEVMVYWEEYSERSAAGWLIPREEDVTHIFGQYGRG